MSAFKRVQTHTSTVELPPHSAEDEAGVLGCILLASEWPAAINDLQPTDFYDFRNCVIFAALRDLHKAGRLTDLITVQKRLKDAQQIEDAGGLVYLSGLMDAVPSAANLPYYLETVVEKADRRSWLQWTAKLKDLITNPQTPSALIREALRGAAAHASKHGAQPPPIRFLGSDAIRSWQPPADHFLLSGGLITRGETALVAGAPGVGKSRAALALAVAGTTGGSWFGLPVATQFRTVIVQNENGRHRLKQDFEALASLGINLADSISVSETPDCGLAFGRADFRDAIRAEVERTNAGLVIVDPWTDATGGDRREDYQEALRNVRQSLPTGDQAPALVIVCHTRKPQGDERHSGRGLLNIVAGSYSIGASARTVFALQAASPEPDDDRVVFTTCKANNCEMPTPTVWHREAARFTPCQDFDWTEFRDGNRGGRPAKVFEDDIRAIFAGGKLLTRKEAADAIAERCGCHSSRGYEYLKHFAKLVHVTQDGKLRQAW